MRVLHTFKSSEKGATAVEYGLIAALIALVLIVSLSATGVGLSANFSNAESGLNQR